jgi:YbbR domain-containing protein
VIALQAYPVVVTSLPVEVQTVGEPAKDLLLTGMKVSPTSVRVQIRRSYAEQTTKVLTEPIQLSEITQTTMLRGRLILPEYMGLVDPADAEVRVTLEMARPAPAGVGSAGN